MLMDSPAYDSHGCLNAENMSIGEDILHQLLADHSSSMEDALQWINHDPFRLQHQDSKHQCPIHIECMNRCRSAIISRCIELYPQALFVESNLYDALPLQTLVYNSRSTIDDALLMIKTYPAALQHRDYYGRPPLHAECMRQCRQAIISKCIELYPEALTKQDKEGYLPLHLTLLSPTPSSMALMLIDKYPAALRHGDSQGYFPLHIECQYQCRPSIISKCIELYPDALHTINLFGHIPWSLALQTAVDLNKNIYKLRKPLLILLSAHPESFYHPPHDPIINKLAMMQDPCCSRMILNLLPSCLSSAAHLQAYHDLNWQPRSSLLYLWLQISLKSREMHASSSSGEHLLKITAPADGFNRKDETVDAEDAGTVVVADHGYECCC
jgi:ankyrin repeat protein